MPEIVIISGKGGTGKTSLTAAFAALAEDKILCDLDVDAPDLHLLLQPQARRTEDFYSGNEAVIDPERCEMCGLCQNMCRFRAIDEIDGKLVINPLKCEGCKVCVHFCAAEAIDFPQRHCGQWYVSDTRFGTMVHAQLFPGEENSGRLVTLLRQEARRLAKESGTELILCDGAPGIGCPVISSLSGTDLAVVVTEPTPSGRHDLERVLQLCAYFRVPAGVIINKYDLNADQTEAIEAYCAEHGLALLARLPHDPAITKAMVQGLAITEYQEDGLSLDLKKAWEEICMLAGRKQEKALLARQA